MQMLHPDGFGAPRPIDVPFVIAAAGPKGIAAAREVGDGVFGAPVPIAGFDWSVVLTFGTVLEDGEAPGSPRALAAAGHAAPVVFHFAVENRRLDMVPARRGMGGGLRERARARPAPRAPRPAPDRGQRPRPAVRHRRACSPSRGWPRRERLARAAGRCSESQGATEIAYQPAGPDIPRELEAFASAVRG